MSRNRGQSSGRRQRRARYGLTSNKASKNTKFLQNVDKQFIELKGYGQRY